MIAIEPITGRNASAFQAVRLRALRDSPGAFGSFSIKEAQLFDAEWLRRSARSTGETSVGYLASDEQTTCGIVRATLDDLDSSVVWVQSMWVAPSHRRLGLGRSLIDAVLEWARGQRVRTLKLMVTRDNHPAIRFYERLGFSPTGNTGPDPNDPALLECEMSRPLS